MWKQWNSTNSGISLGHQTLAWFPEYARQALRYKLDILLGLATVAVSGGDFVIGIFVKRDAYESSENNKGIPKTMKGFH
jgi:hypothetical protein